jgi:hypothetical protein
MRAKDNHSGEETKTYRIARGKEFKRIKIFDTQMPPFSGMRGG